MHTVEQLSLCRVRLAGILDWGTVPSVLKERARGRCLALCSQAMRYRCVPRCGVLSRLGTVQRALTPS